MQASDELNPFSQPARARVAGLLPRGARAADELEHAASVLVAIGFAHMAGAQVVFWAAFSGYLVMRGRVADTLRRGALRVSGSCAGALLATLLVPWLSQPWLQALALLAISTLAMYGCLTSRHSYAWFLTGLTFALVLLTHIEQPAVAVQSIVRTRVLEIVAGTGACVVVSLLSALSLRRIWPAASEPIDASTGWQPRAARHAAQAGVGVALLPLVHTVWAQPAIGQAAITMLALMVVPLASIGTGGLRAVRARTVQRVLGCACGAAYGSAVLLGARGNVSTCLAATAIGAMLGRHVETGRHAWPYSGAQFTLAMLVTLVPDSYAHPDMHAGFARLLGVAVGIALLEPVLLAWQLLFPLREEGAAAH